MDYWLYIGIFAVALAVFSMIDILRIRMTNNQKIVWFAIVVLIPVIGPLVYIMKRKGLASG